MGEGEEGEKEDPKPKSVFHRDSIVQKCTNLGFNAFFECSAKNDKNVKIS
jgi:hypothetical protein